MEDNRLEPIELTESELREIAGGCGGCGCDDDLSVKIDVDVSICL
jgi:hypothetical protein